MNEQLTIVQGDALSVLQSLPDGSVNCCVTSPPYFRQRDYHCDGQLGMEFTPQEYVDKLVLIFRELLRVLRDDGTFWLVIGDSYANDGKFGGKTGGKQAYLDKSSLERCGREKVRSGLKPKNLMLIPWRVGLALQAGGWILRDDIIWHKPNAMSESVQDRPTRAHEYVLFFVKSARYWYDAQAIRTAPSPALLKQIAEGYSGEATKDFAGNLVQDASATKSRIINGARRRIDKQRGHGRRHDGFNDRWDQLTREEQMACGANKRDVWTVATANFPSQVVDGKELDHFAVYPEELVKPCILAGCPAGGLVIDPFCGSGTTGKVALENGRRALLSDLNPDYVELARQRCVVQPGLVL